MVQPYPKEDHLVGNFAPIRMECNIDDLIIDGDIPKELMGHIIEMDLIQNFLQEVGVHTGLVVME